MRYLLPAGIVATVLIASPLSAQVTVQQPVVQSFGASTTVSVPDRGRTHIGSVSSAAASRSMTGPFRSGTSMGLEARGGSMSVGVFIHDLREMDEALLASARSSTFSDAWERRLAERRGPQSATTVAGRVAKPANRVTEYETLAQRAEERGKTAVAQVYWRMAAKEGSALAQARLTDANRPSKIASKSAR